VPAILTPGKNMFFKANGYRPAGGLFGVPVRIFFLAVCREPGFRLRILVVIEDFKREI
jgi:hypothetical protein